MHHLKTEESVTELQAYLQVRRDIINLALDIRLPGIDKAPGEVHKAMRYAVLGQGKRLRPILTLAVADLCNVQPESMLDAACAIELAHTASLILDDLPCMDNGITRRGLPCTHLAFDKATAILASMGLISLGFQLIVQNCASLNRNESTGDAVLRFAEAIGTGGLVYGQHLDLCFTGNTPSLSDLECIHHHKASVLFLSALEVPAIVLGMDTLSMNALQVYAENLGLAFQITDDLLDACKVSGEDDGKSTFATHLGVCGAKDKVQKLTNKAIGALEVFADRADMLRLFPLYVQSRNT